MATHTTSRSESMFHRLLWPIGFVLLMSALVVGGIWALKAFGASYSGTIVDDSIAHDVVDLIWAPGTGEAGEETSLMLGMDQSGKVIWEGSDEEWGALRGDAESEYQADLRNTWLYPSIAIGVIGFLLIFIGRRRTVGEQRDI